MAAVVVLVRLYLDVEMIALGLVKLELINALQLEQHAGIRSGAMVLMTDSDLPYRALHHWILHIPMLFSPRPESAAILLVMVDFLTAGAWFYVIDKRWGRVASSVAVALYLSTPVAPILSKHVIATAFVPLAGAALVEGFLRLHDRQRGGLRWTLWGFAFLLVFNINHIVLLPAVVWMLWGKVKAERFPWVGLLFVVLSAAPLLNPLEGATVLELLGEVKKQVLDLSANPEWFFRRMIFVEPYMTEMAPFLYAWPLLLVLGAGAAIRLRKNVPGGLLPLVASFPLFLLVFDVEATVVWQAALFLLMAWTASEYRSVALASLAYGLIAQIVIAHTFLTFGPPPQSNFFSLSTIAQKDAMLTVLREEMEMKQEELYTLRVEHEIGENGLPAPAPGLRYLADLGPELPPGGDRCLAVSQQPLQLGTTAEVVKRHEEGGLHYTAWRGGEECTTNLVHPLPKAVYLDWNTWSLTTTPPWRVGTNLPH